MSSVTEEFRIALETERKFEFYITGAIFTILGLSVQFSGVYDDRLRNILLLGAYLFLSLSALCAAVALSRFVRRNWIIAEVQDLEADLQTLRAERASGKLAEGLARDRRSADFEGDLARAQDTLSDEAARAVTIKNVIRYMRELRNWSFLLGLILLLFARIWPVFVSVVG
jgi:hypothetical protein